MDKKVKYLVTAHSSKKIVDTNFVIKTPRAIIIKFYKIVNLLIYLFTLTKPRVFTLWSVPEKVCDRCVLSL